MKKVPEHVAIITGAGSSSSDTNHAASLQAGRAVLLSAQQIGVRYLSFCPEAGGGIFAGMSELARKAQALAQGLGQRPPVSVQIVEQSGRQDIVEATRKLAARVKSGHLRAEDLSAELLRETLSTAAFPDPDLIILCGRSGASLLSRCLLFESAYAEMYFCSAAWPDFSAADWQRALSDYSQRERRFGRTSDQLQPALHWPSPASLSP